MLNAVLEKSIYNTSVVKTVNHKLETRKENVFDRRTD